MRIVHVAQSIAGGIASYFEEIADYQRTSFGQENVFFVVPEGSSVHLPRISSDQLITFRGSGRGSFDLLIFGVTAFKAIRRLEPNVVHLHSSFAGAIVRPFLWRTERQARVVYCPHGWAFGMETTNFKRFAYAELERLLAKHTDLIVVNSDAERRLGAQFRIPVRKMRTVKNGIGRKTTPAPDKPKPQSNRMDMVFVGRHDRQKGLDILLTTFKDLPSDRFHLHVVGEGILEKGCAPESALRENVTFYGWLSRNDIFALLGRMDALLMPSRWEAFGLVAIEAMRSGVPVLASDRGALPEIIRHGVDGYIFDLDDPGALRRLLDTLTHSSLRRMGESARARFEAEFTADRMNAEIQRVYGAALGTEDAAQTSLAGAFGAAKATRGEFSEFSPIQQKSV